ncbi:MAG: DUF1700 domain-containing protein [Clostridia bacterium]|jgi:uncharacterized membrane protein
MKRDEYMRRLDTQLDGKLNREEIKNAISYYDDLLIEAVETGRNEEDVIAEIGSVEDAVAKIKAEAFFQRAEKKGKMSGYLKAIIAVLSICAIPIAISVIAVIFSLLVALFAIVLSIFAVVLSIGVAAIVLVVSGFTDLFTTNVFQSVPLISAGMVLTGITLFSVLFSIKIIQWLRILFSKIFKCIYKKIGRKGGAKYE